MSKKAKAGGPKAAAAVRKAPPGAAAKAGVAAFLAWLFPGAGHLFLGRWVRAGIFAFLVLLTLVIGWQLQGKLFLTFQGSPLEVLGTLGSMGSGAPYFVLRFGLGYEGDLNAVGYDFGTAFLLTAGLMNLLLVLDAWDIAMGLKE